MSIFKTVGKAFAAHNNAIYTITAIVGVIATGVSAVRATKKCMVAIEEAKEAKLEEITENMTQEQLSTEEVEELLEQAGKLTTEEKIEVCWKYAIGPVVAGATSIAAIIANDKSHKKKYALLAATCQAAQRLALDNGEIIKKAEEMIGSEKIAEVRKSVADDKLSRVNPNDIPDQNGTHFARFVDEITGSQWWGDPEIVDKAINEYHKRCAEGGYCAYSDFLMDAGCPLSEIGDISHNIFYGMTGLGSVVVPGLYRHPAYMNDGVTHCHHIRRKADWLIDA